MIDLPATPMERARGTTLKPRLGFLISGLCAAATVAASLPAQTRWPADRYQFRRLALDSAPLCRQTVPVLTPDSLGPLRTGQPLRDVERACPHVLYWWSWTVDGIPTPAVLLRFGHAFIEAVFSDTLSTSLVLRLVTHSPLIRTVEGFGPGSRLAWISRSWGAHRFGERECVLYTWYRSRPGIIFQVNVPDDSGCDAGQVVRDGERARLPWTTTVREVVLVRHGK